MGHFFVDVTDEVGVRSRLYFGAGTWVTWGNKRWVWAGFDRRGPTL